MNAPMRLTTRLVILIGCGVCLGLLLCLVLRAGPGKSPALECANPVYDFGIVSPSTILHHSFALRNGGKAPLKIERLKSSCGCISAEIHEPVIRPGTMTHMEVSFVAPDMRGPYKGSIMAMTNAPDKSHFIFQVVADVLREVEIQPAPIDFGIIRRDQLPAMRRAILVFAHADANAVREPYLQSDQEWLCLRAQGESTLVERPFEVLLQREIPNGPIEAYVSVFDQREQKCLARTPVIGEVRGNAYAKPNRVVLDLSSGADQEPKSVEILSSHGRPEIRRAELSETLSPYLFVTVESAESRVRLSLNSTAVRQAGSSIPKAIKGRIHLDIQFAPPTQEGSSSSKNDRSAEETTEGLDVPVLGYTH